MSTLVRVLPAGASETVSGTRGVRVRLALELEAPRTDDLLPGAFHGESALLEPIFMVSGWRRRRHDD